MPRESAGDLAHNQTVSLLLARAMWDCPTPLVMTASSSQGTTGASWRKTGRRACDSVDMLTRLAHGGGKHTFRFIHTQCDFTCTCVVACFHTRVDQKQTHSGKTRVMERETRAPRQCLCLFFFKKKFLCMFVFVFVYVYVYVYVLVYVLVYVYVYVYIP